MERTEVLDAKMRVVFGRISGSGLSVVGKTYFGCVDACGITSSLYRRDTEE